MNHLTRITGTSRHPLATGCALLVGLLAPAFAQYTGEFSAANLGTGDSDALVGLRTDKDYLYAFNLGSANTLVINGVTFTGVAGTDPTSPGQFSFTGTTNLFPGGGTNPGGQLGVLTNDFVYGAGTVAETMNINGLLAGESYVVTFYNRSWEAAGGRLINLTASNASTVAAGFVFDEDIGATAQGSLNVFRYTFQAATTQQVLNFIQQVSGTTFHQYGFTVERTFNNTWTSGTDFTAAVWSGAAPIEAGRNASFGVQAAPTTMNLDADVTLGHLQFDGANAWTLSSTTGRTLTLQADVGGITNISAKVGVHTISTPIVLMNNLMKTGNGTLNLTGNVSGDATVHLAGGTLQMSGTNTYTGETKIAGGGTLEVTTVSDYGVPSAIGARTFAQENNTVTGIGLHFQGGVLKFVGSTAQSTNRQIRILNGNSATINASGTTPEATLSFTFSGTNINLFDTGGTRTLTLTGTNTGANTFAIQLTDQATNATSINKSGVGTWFLTNNNSNYTGLMQISGGVLNVASLSNYGTPSAIGARNSAQETATGNGIGIWFGPSTSTGILQYTGSTPQSTNRQIRVGTGGATFDASGSTPSATMSFTYSGTNTNLFDTGGTRTITLTGSNTGANVFAIQLTDQAANATSFNKRGVGTWNLTNTNSTYSGVTAIENGVLNVASVADYGLPSALGNRAAVADVASNIGIVFRGGTLQYTGATAQTTNRAIRVSTNGGATIDASGANSAATLSFAATASPDFFENSGNRSLALTGTNSGRNVFGMAITETGGQTTLTKNGAGMWILTGASTYTGATNVNAGTLRVNGSLANTAVTVAGGGTIGGSGTIAGPVSVSSGAHVAPGDGVGTLTVASLSLAAGAVLDFEFNPTADLVNVTGAGGLTINGGGLNLLAEGGAAPFAVNGTYTLFNYEGTFAGAIANFAVLNSQAGKFYSVADDPGTTTITLTIADAVSREWNTNASGQWTTAGNWTGGIPNSAGVVAKFGGVPAGAINVAVSGAKTIGGLLFENVNSYTVSGGAGDTITLDNGLAAGGITVLSGSHTVSAPVSLAGNLSASVAAGGTLVVVGNISGAGRNVLYSGPGTMILAGTNNYASTTVTSGTLQIGMSGSTGTLGSGDVTLASGATLSLNRTDAFTLANNILGPEATLAKASAGRTTLTGTNTIGSIGAGIVNVLAGTLALGSAGALPANVSLGVNGGTLDLNGFDLSVRSLALQNGTITDASATAGTTTVQLNAPGTSIVTGNITSGPTRILAVNLNTGTLQIGAGGTTGALAATSIDIASGAALNFNRTDELIVSTNITGVAAVVNQVGTGITTLTGASTFPTLNVSSGTVKVGSATALSPTVAVNLNTGTLDLNERSPIIGSILGTGTVLNNGAAASLATLIVGGTVNSTFSGVIADGTGKTALSKAGPGTLTLSGAAPNAYTGLTTVTNGTLQLQKDPGSTAVVGDILIGDALGSDILQLGAANQISDTSVVTFTAGGSGNSAFFRLNGFNETVRGIQTTVGQSSVLENNGAAGSVSVLTVNTAGSDFTYDGIIRNASTGTSTFALTKVGAGTLTLASTAAVAINSYTGSTTINEGKMVFENLSGFNGPVVVNNLIPDALTVNQNTRDLRMNGVVSGAGGITKNGPFTLTLGGANTVTGTITVNDGILGLANNAAVGNATIIMNGGNIRAADAGRVLSNPVIVNGSFTLGRLTDLIGSITLNANATITADNPDGPANNNSALGIISGNFRVSFAEGTNGIGTGALIVNSVNTNTGGTSVLSGRVNVGPTGALSEGPLVVDGGELNFGNTAQTVASLSGLGGSINLGGGHILTVNQSTDTTYAGGIGGSGGLTKSGPGTLTLTGLGFFSGPATITEGTVVVNAALSGSTLTVSGGTLGGNGFAGNVVSTGGRITPGDGVGTLTFNSLQMDAASVWRFELASPGAVGVVNDLITINDALTLDGTLQVVALPGFGVGTYRLANYTGLLTDSGLVLDPAFLQQFPGSSIDTSTPGEVNLVFVPEPASAILLLGGLGAITTLRRRRAV